MTLYRVTEPNEVNINGLGYRLKGGITSSLMSVYPPKTVTGDYTKDSQPYASVHTWSDWRGGVGVDRWLDARDDNRSWFSTAHTEHRNHLLLPPLVTETASATGLQNASGIGELAGLIYALFNTDIKSYTIGTDTWSASLHTISGASSELGTHVLSDAQIGGSRYLIFGTATQYDYTTNGTVWSTSTKNAYQLAVWDNRLWGIDTGGQLWYTFTPGSAEVNDAICPMISPDSQIVLFVGPDSSGEPILYAYTGLGLFAHDAANARFVKTRVPALGINQAYGAYGVVWNGKIHLAYRQTVLEYDPVAGSIRLIGVDKGDGIPTDYLGWATGMVPTPDGLLVGTRERSPGTISVIWKWDGVGWSVLYANASTSNGIRALWYSESNANNNVWWGGVSVAQLAWMAYPVTALNPKQDTGYTYAASAIHKTPWFDAGQHEVTKTLLQVRVITQDCDANDTVAVRIAYDYTEGASDASYTLLGTITTNGTTTYNLPDSTTPTGTDFNAVRIKLTLSGGASTTSPDVSSVTLVYRKKLPVKTTHEFVIDLDGEYKGRSPKEMRADLVTAISSTTKVQLTFRDDSGDTRNYFVDIVSLKGLQQSGLDETGAVSVVAVEP